MRCISNIRLVVLLILTVLPQIANSQNKEITAWEISRMEQSAISILRAGPYRSIFTSWVFPERGKEHSFKTTMITEVDIVGHTRSVQENDTPGSFKRMEVMSISGQHYRKIDDGPWQLLTPPPLGYGQPMETPKSTGSKPRFENSAKLVETLTGKNGTVSVYETVSKSTRDEDGKEVTRISTNRFWFRYDGMLLRKDMETETIGEPRILKNSMIFENENIPRLEAPKVDQ